MDKLAFANELAIRDLGPMAASMTDCEKYGMLSGCDGNCPQLGRGECEVYSSVDEYFKERDHD